MASVRKGTRQKAVIGASQAMLGSLGFFVRESLPLSKQSADIAFDASLTALKLNNALLAYLDLVEEPPKIDPKVELDKAVVRIKKRAFDLAAIGFIIPLLLNKEARDYLSNFAAGLIGVENLEKFKIGLIAVTGVLTGVFTYKLIKQVGDSIEAVKRLSQIVGTLFGITEAASSDIDLEKKSLDDDKKKIEEEKKKKELEDKKTRDAASKGRDDIKASKQEYKKANFFGKVKFLATKFGPKVLGAVVKSIPVVGAVATIGLLISEIASFFIDGEEEEKQSVSEAKPGVASSSSTPPPPGHSAQEVQKTIQSEKPAPAATASASKPPEKMAPVQSAGTSSTPSVKPSENNKDDFDGFLKKKMKEADDFQEGKVNLDGKVIETKPSTSPTSIPAPVVESKPPPTATDTFNKTPGGKDLPKGVTRDPMSGAYIFNKEMFTANTEEAFNAIIKALQTGKSVTYIDDDRNAGRVKKTFDPKSKQYEILGPADSGESVAKDSEEVVGKKKQSGSKILIVNNIDNKVVTAASKE